MSGDPNSSSMGSSSVGGAPRTFDVQEEGQILKLLNAIRNESFAPEEKVTLRDAVLDYAEAKDVTLLNAIAPKFGEKGITLTVAGNPVDAQSQSREVTPEVSQEAQTPPATQSNIRSFGGARPQPSFAPTSVSQTQRGSSEEKILEAKPQESATEAASSDVLQTAPQAVPSTPPAPVEPAAPSAPTPAPSMTEAQNTATADSTPVPKTSYANPLDRVKEIKRLVNEKVGNPVNLIDANNTVGREYMNALLNAMKLVNSGSPEEVNLAMDRLEKAFTSVEESIKSGETVIGEKKAPVAPSTQTKTEETKPTPSDLPTTPSTSHESEELHKESGEQSEGEKMGPPPEPIHSVKQAEPTPLQKLAADTKLPPPEPAARPAAEANIRPPAAAPVNTTPASPNEQVQSAPATPPQAAPLTPPPMAEAPKAASVASLVQKENAALQKVAAAGVAAREAKEAADLADPLHATEVTAGLQQLLSEWKLFKSSGIFGTGPSGAEHPLFKTIGPLAMAAVVSGRFEGATPEIRQSIADYMNGWRYEQNVVHEMSETFEHYLRRVIRNILDRQKTNPPA